MALGSFIYYNDEVFCVNILFFFIRFFSNPLRKLTLKDVEHLRRGGGSEVLDTLRKKNFSLKILDRGGEGVKNAVFTDVLYERPFLMYTHTPRPQPFLNTPMHCMKRIYIELINEFNK